MVVDRKNQRSGVIWSDVRQYRDGFPSYRIIAEWDFQWQCWQDNFFYFPCHPFGDGETERGKWGL